ncbi:kinesin-related protein 6-like [Malaya genurostris]|uniref:kinesin-related protein 6-like n=1 Tax=Malaya genurostris TaxID=325434 RepID=UPI0026F3BB74|nr:kinesin-related protein 6-like [Malaya genurostris]XP_058447596.1 kinesin-related protein 6-like [Malaya genurostris]XP_058447597.1 kinesin-related protein 6-like [Malaya genurostris]XP_058447598.1 kinesin-related protein 6-like [Malaya genurostris]
MTSVKDTASFFANGSSSQFDFVLNLYPQVLKLRAENKCKKPEELIRLDDWYQNMLPQLIKKRGKEPFMVHEELVQTMRWKQTRGRFFPQLSYLIKVNTPRAVQNETKKAFKKLPNLEQAITALSNLKGVGTTMASALLAAAAPETAPFMADECLMAIPEIEGIDYTTREYMNFVQHIQATTDRLNEEVHGPVSSSNNDGSNDEEEEDSSNDAPKIEKKWSPHNVELALWTHYVARELQPELLDEMPAATDGTKNSYSRNPISTAKTTTTSAATNGASVSLASSENNTMEEPSDESNLDTELGKATSDESSKDNKYTDSLDECTKSEDSLEKPSTTTTSIRNNNSDEVVDSDSQSSAKQSTTGGEEEEDDDEDEEEDEEEDDDEESSADGAPEAKKAKID